MKGFGAEEFLGYIAYNVMCGSFHICSIIFHTSCFYLVDRMCNVKTFAVLHSARNFSPSHIWYAHTYTYCYIPYIIIILKTCKPTHNTYIHHTVIMMSMLCQTQDII